MENSENSPSTSPPEDELVAQELVEDLREQWVFMTLEGRQRIAAKYPRTFELAGLNFNAPRREPEREAWMDDLPLSEQED